jgi:CheY-like chemotaxis protein
MAKRVLVVDDDADIRETVSLILKDEGWEVSLAADGAAALTLLRSGAPRPNVILLDLMMPVMNGWQFREEQLKDPQLASIPLVVLSANSAVRGKAGYFGGAYLSKPVNIEALLGALSAA